MSQTLDEFRINHLAEMKRDSLSEGMTPDQYFIQYMLKKLQDMGEIIDPIEINTCVDKYCRNQRKMSVDGYSFDESDKSIVLYINDYVDSLSDASITKSRVVELCKKMLYFLEEVYDGELGKYFDDSNEILSIGESLKTRLRRDYIDLNNDISIDKIKLFVVTNKLLSSSVKQSDFGIDEFKGKKIIVNVWSIQRIYEHLLSGKEKEPVIVNVKNFGFDGIPCLKAEMSMALDYDAYLAIIPGQLLHNIYYEYGSRLLEGNVRTFLSVKGKVNKGIRNTIKNEPTKFFTYNNGIACTAAKVVLDITNTKIIEMHDLQIINGGQTTASLTSAILDKHVGLDKESGLSNIFVPLKLTVVKNADYDTIISNISKYANSQNKITEADMLSNHLFHRSFEDLSKKYIAPAREGELYDTYWYYERSRGKYEQEKFKLTTNKQKEDYEKKWPRKQVIKKEELAKYYMACSELRPDIVAKGSQKCMLAFAALIDKMVQSAHFEFNKFFYERMICYAILYRETDKIVQHASWYNVGGYKLNIVPYTISKLISMIPKGSCLNYKEIWEKQTLQIETVQMIKKLAYVTNNFIQNTANGVIVTEHCKKEDTWKSYSDLHRLEDYITSDYNIKVNKTFFDTLIFEEVWQINEESAIKKEKAEKTIDDFMYIYKLGSDYWSRLLTEGSDRKILSEKETMILKNIITNKIVSVAHAKVACDVRKRLEEAGVFV
ncbi:MAG: AIPR family protein [Christensenellaceae bacterium]|jgi:hypothetical protein|nr:AIPR family protein [Christensenellaceae bacterium]